jgi:uncharacterized protein YndB with AHSA1/START domain
MSLHQREDAVFTKTVAGLIARPIDEVFAFLSDPRNRPRWEVFTEKAALTSPEPIGVGSTVLTTLRVQDTRSHYTWEVIEHQPPNRQVVQSTAGRIPTTLTYQLDAQDGETWVQLSVTGRPGGRLRLLQPVIAYSASGRLRSSFRRLKQALEAGATI